MKICLFSMTLYVGVRYHALARAYSQQHIVAWSGKSPRDAPRSNGVLHSALFGVIGFNYR